jgi:hypothetical protein
MSGTAGLTDITVAVEGGKLGKPLVVGRARLGRVHLLYRAEERTAPTVDVSVGAARSLWRCAGMAALPAPPGALAAWFKGNRWAALLAGGLPGPAVRGLRRVRNGRAASVTFFPPPGERPHD